MLGESSYHEIVLIFRTYTDLMHGYSPGRFFAANELKAMLAYIVLNYDVKLPEDKQVSDPLEADQGSQILFRRRLI